MCECVRVWERGSGHVSVIFIYLAACFAAIYVKNEMWWLLCKSAEQTCYYEIRLLCCYKIHTNTLTTEPSNDSMRSDIIYLLWNVFRLERFAPLLPTHSLFSTNICSSTDPSAPTVTLSPTQWSAICISGPFKLLGPLSIYNWKRLLWDKWTFKLLQNIK